MPNNLTAIPTTYRGVHFRSRLEARWAVFFDALGIRWEYECRLFSRDEVYYLPDFHLPGHDAWGEVKPEALDAASWRKAKLLVRQARRPLLLLVGLPSARPVQSLDWIAPPERHGFEGCWPPLDEEGFHPGWVDFEQSGGAGRVRRAAGLSRRMKFQ
jgi:hypothetical protein